VANLSNILDFAVVPDAWNSAHQPIQYFGISKSRTAAITNDGGKALLTLNFFFPLTMEVGAYVVILSGAYKGTHLITNVTSSIIFKIDTPYTVNDSSNVLYYPVLRCSIYKGYKALEQYPSQLPYTKITDFNIEPNLVGDSTGLANFYRWDVSGYLKSIFSIEPPTVGVDFSMFNRFRLTINNTFLVQSEIENHQVVNAAISQQVLNTLYVNTGLPLNENDVIVFSCGETIFSTIEGGAVVNTEFDGCIVGGFDIDDFDNNDFNINICP
jgi:hypothetical protein